MVGFFCQWKSTPSGRGKAEAGKQKDKCTTGAQGARPRGSRVSEHCSEGLVSSGQRGTAGKARGLKVAMDISVDQTSRV